MRSTARDFALNMDVEREEKDKSDSDEDEEYNGEEYR